MAKTKKSTLKKIMKAAAGLRRRGLSKKEAMKRAWAMIAPKKKRTKAKAAPKTRAARKRGGRKLARKKKQGRRRKFSILTAIAASGHLFSGTWAPIQDIREGRYADALEHYIVNLTGYGYYSGEWNPMWLIKGWTPTIIALIAKKIVSYLGINRYFRDLPVNL